LKNAEDLTPQYLENISAAQLRNAGLTMVAVAETQQWLMNNGVSLKRKPPKSTAEIQAVKRAIATLDAFQFGIENVQSQLNFLENESI
jgi:hypothetical protein